MKVEIFISLVQFAERVRNSCRGMRFTNIYCIHFITILQYTHGCGLQPHSALHGAAERPRQCVLSMTLSSTKSGTWISEGSPRPSFPSVAADPSLVRALSVLGDTFGATTCKPPISISFFVFA